mmetsp:Transcript_20706/g.3349  ORF Transcript_20706/g.3349 Transcript_20706/m.3349 type:complete len:105 (+) Transcript_20706:40-354(+)
MSTKPTVGYWDIRGIGAHIRLLLTHLGVDFDFRGYVCGDGPQFDRSDWFNEKFTLGLQFPNLPYLIDGDVKVTETTAILSYVCQKYRPEYLGRTPEETRLVWMI